MSRYLGWRNQHCTIDGSQNCMSICHGKFRVKSTLRIIVLTVLVFFLYNAKSFCYGTKKNLLRTSKIHTTTTQTSNLSHFNSPGEAELIRVNLRAFVLLFKNEMLRCFNVIENPATYQSWL